MVDTMENRKTYFEIIKENIEYDYLLQSHSRSQDVLGEILNLMLDVICTTRKTIRIGGEDRPAVVARSRLLKLTSEHISYVLEALSKNTTDVRNIKAYLLTTLYNAPATIESYYQARVNHDLYGKSSCSSFCFDFVLGIFMFVHFPILPNCLFVDLQFMGALPFGVPHCPALLNLCIHLVSHHVLSASCGFSIHYTADYRWGILLCHCGDSSLPVTSSSYTKQSTKWSFTMPAACMNA